MALTLFARIGTQSRGARSNGNEPRSLNYSAARSLLTCEHSVEPLIHIVLTELFIV